MSAAVPSFAEVFQNARPLYEAAAERVPAHDAIHAVELVLTWRWLRAYLGREPLDREHWEALDVSRATYYRRLATVRKAYDARRIGDVAIAPAAAMPTLGTALQVGLT